MSQPPAVHLSKHTRRKFRQPMQSGELKVCIIPVAAVEEHLREMMDGTREAALPPHFP